MPLIFQILNFTKSEFRNAFHFVQGDFVDFTSLPDPFFDLIISNPPYFIKDLNASEQSKNLQRHFTLKKISDLVFNVSKLLTDKGLFILVLPVWFGVNMDHRTYLQWIVSAGLF